MNPAACSSADAPRILVTRLSHIGDCILTLPMVNAIKRQCPHAVIHWAVESPTDQLLRDHPAIDDLIKVPRGWAGKPKHWRSLRATFREHDYDIAIDPQGITKSAGLGWLSGAPVRIGIRGRWGRELSPWLNNRLIRTKHPHLVDRSLELLAGLGLDGPNDPVTFDLPLCPDAVANVRRWIDGQTAAGLLDTERVFLINPGGSWASKRWVLSRFGELATQLQQVHGWKGIIVWAGEEERQMAAAVHDVAPEATVVACPTSLRELAALSASVRFFIGGDTGPLHIASAVGTPCVGLYGTTRPADSGAYGSHHIAVQRWYQAGSCRQRRSAENTAMRDIQVPEVFAACEEIMARLAGSHSTAGKPAA